MTKSWPLWLFSGIILCSGWGCRNNFDEVEKLMTDTVAVHDRAENIEVIYSDSAMLKAKIFSPFVERYQSGGQDFMEMKKGLHAFFYDENQKIESSLRSDYGISNETTKQMEVRNDVQVVNIKGEKLFTEKLIWDQQTQRIYTDEFVKIVRPADTILGNGMESNQNFTQWRIKKPRGIMSVKD